MHCPHFDCNLWIFRRARKSAGCSGRCVSERGGGFDLGIREYGFGNWRNDLQPGSRLADRPLLISPGICSLRGDPGGRRVDGLDPAAKCRARASAAASCTGLTRRSARWPRTFVSNEFGLNRCSPSAVDTALGDFWSGDNSVWDLSRETSPKKGDTGPGLFPSSWASLDGVGLALPPPGKEILRISFTSTP